MKKYTLFTLLMIVALLAFPAIARADDELPPLDQAMDVIAGADPHACRPFSISSARMRSSGVVILIFS